MKIAENAWRGAYLRGDWWVRGEVFEDRERVVDAVAVGVEGFVEALEIRDEEGQKVCFEL